MSLTYDVLRCLGTDCKAECFRRAWRDEAHKMRNRSRTEDKAASAEAYKQYAISRPVNATPSITHGNATTSRDYRGVNMQSPCANADQHLQHASLGLGVQLEVA